MRLLHHKSLGKFNLLLLPLQLSEIILQLPRLLLEILLQKSQSLSEESIQALLDVIRIAFESSHLLNQRTHLVLYGLFLVLYVLVPAFQYLQGR